MSECSVYKKEDQIWKYVVAEDMKREACQLFLLLLLLL